MWFLIKGTFWFSMVLVLLPFLDAGSSAKLENGPTVELGETFSAASEAVTYMKGLCLEKPEVCRTGSETFVALGHRAREGARIAYQFLDQQFAEENVAATTDPARKQALAQPLPIADTETATIDADTVVTGTIAIPTRRPDHKG